MKATTLRYSRDEHFWDHLDVLLVSHKPFDLLDFKINFLLFMSLNHNTPYRLVNPWYEHPQGHLKSDLLPWSLPCVNWKIKRLKEVETQARVPFIIEELCIMANNIGVIKHFPLLSTPTYTIPMLLSASDMRNHFPVWMQIHSSASRLASQSLSHEYTQWQTSSADKWDHGSCHLSNHIFLKWWAYQMWVPHWKQSDQVMYGATLRISYLSKGQWLEFDTGRKDGRIIRTCLWSREFQVGPNFMQDAKSMKGLSSNSILPWVPDE